MKNHNMEVLNGLNDYLEEQEEQKDKTQEEQNRIAIEAINVLIHDRINTTKEVIKKYPFLVSFMEEHGCNNISIGHDISKLDKNSLNKVGNMQYYEWDYYGIRYFVIDKDLNIVEVPGRIGGAIEFLPENVAYNKEKNVNKIINKSSKFLITFMEDADKNESHMVISKLI